MTTTTTTEFELHDLGTAPAVLEDHDQSAVIQAVPKPAGEHPADEPQHEILADQLVDETDHNAVTQLNSPTTPKSKSKWTSNRVGAIAGCLALFIATAALILQYSGNVINMRMFQEQIWKDCRDREDMQALSVCSRLSAEPFAILRPRHGSFYDEDVVSEPRSGSHVYWHDAERFDRIWIDGLTSPARVIVRSKVDTDLTKLHAVHLLELAWELCIWFWHWTEFLFATILLGLVYTHALCLWPLKHDSKSTGLPTLRTHDDLESTISNPNNITQRSSESTDHHQLLPQADLAIRHTFTSEMSKLSRADWTTLHIVTMLYTVGAGIHLAIIYVPKLVYVAAVMYMANLASVAAVFTLLLLFCAFEPSIYYVRNPINISRSVVLQLC